jgi:hypothetical protein
MIAKDFFLAKDPYRIGALILRDHVRNDGTRSAATGISADSGSPERFLAVMRKRQETVISARLG